MCPSLGIEVHFHVCTDLVGPVICNWRRRGPEMHAPFGEPRTHMTTLQSQEIKELAAWWHMSNPELQGKVIGSPLKAMEAVAGSRSIFMFLRCSILAAKTFNNLAWGYERKCSCPPITTDRFAMFCADLLMSWHTCHTWLPFVTAFGIRAMFVHMSHGFAGHVLRHASSIHWRPLAEKLISEEHAIKTQWDYQWILPKAFINSVTCGHFCTAAGV